MEIPRIDHVNIVVSDLDRSIRFFSEVLLLRRGFEAVLEGEWLEQVTGLPGARAHCVFMETDDPNVRLELLAALDPEGQPVPLNSMPHTPGLRHVAFKVGDLTTLHAVVARAKAAGATVIHDPVEVPFRVGSLGRKYMCYFLDPDGTLIEAAAYEREAP